MLMQNKNLRKKGSSLLEVIIVLVIVSFTIIASMALVARTRLEIRNNETEDKVNGVLIKALEALKAPTKVLISGNVNFSNTTTYFFSLKPSGSEAFILEYKRPGTFTALPKNDNFNFSDVCRNDNAFFMTDDQNFRYCQQVEIKPVDVAKKLYQVTTTIVYQTSNGSKSETLTSYRYDGFQIQN
jgi:type II secretory pathway pseudopilin PulG